MFDIQNRSEYLIVANVTKSGVKYNCVCNLGDFHVIFLTDEELSERRDKLGVILGKDNMSNGYPKISKRVDKDNNSLSYICSIENGYVIVNVTSIDGKLQYSTVGRFRPYSTCHNTGLTAFQEGYYLEMFMNIVRQIVVFELEVNHNG